MEFINFAAAILVGLLILLLIRELVCWYWKINIQVKQNDEIIELLKRIYGDKQNHSMPLHSHGAWRNDDE